MWTVLIEVWEGKGKGKVSLSILAGEPCALVGGNFWMGGLLTMSFKLDLELFECEDETSDDNGDRR